MTLPTPLVLTVAGVAGTVGAFFGFQQLTASAEPVTPVGVATPAASTPSAEPIVRFRPCPEGFSPSDGKCVQRIERTVVAPVDVAPVATAPSSSPSPRGGHGDDPLTHDVGDDHGDDDALTHDVGDDHGGDHDTADDDHSGPSGHDDDDDSSGHGGHGSDDD